MEHMTLILFFTIGSIGRIFAANPCIPRDYNNGGTVCVCNATYCDTIDKPGSMKSGQYALYISTLKGLRFHSTNGTFNTKIRTNEVECKGATFKINGTKVYQEMKGFGGAFTDAAGINILSLSENTQDKLLRCYYSDDGIDFNMGRVPIGGTDFSTHPYTYDDGNPDPHLDRFNLTKEDLTYKIPLILRAKMLSEGKIHLIGTAWSAPIYMKTNKKITGFGFLLKNYSSTWADYHIKFLDEYKKYNISFMALTTGNEPMNGIVPIARFNSMGWTPWTHRKWISEELGPKLQSSHPEVLLIGFDDQRLMLPWWMKLVLEDAEADKYIKGIGIHWYTDFITPTSILKHTHDAFPEKFLLYTEACTGDKPWSRGVLLGSWDRAEEYLSSLIETTNNWVTGWVDWNLALDLQGGPNWNKNFVDSAIIVNATADEFYKQPIFYALGHVSKFIKKGALRIDIQPQEVDNVNVMAVQNPDKKVVVVFHNKANKVKDVIIEDLNTTSCIKIQLPEKSFATLIYTV